jgi:predicted aspartyl protease
MVGKKKLHFLVDTGSSFSVLSRSAALKAGLRIRPVHYEIESALGRKLHADVAVGDVAVAGTLVHNVVFLVLPDQTMGHALPYPGVIGIPVLRVLGPLTFSRHADTPAGREAALVFRGGSPSVEIVMLGTHLACALDTGSDRSWFPPPSGVAAWKLHHARRLSAVRSVVGTDRRISAFEVPLKFSVAGRSAVLRRALIIKPAEPSRSETFCTLGADAIAALAPVSLDISRMKIVLQ